MTNVPLTYGALLLGGLYASLLSGAVALQVIIYFKMYDGDHTRIKALVVVIWVLDILHTALVWSALWNYFIQFFTFETHIETIYWALSSTVAVTGILTFLVHCFYSHRIYMLGKGNWYLAGPIFLLALCRLISASICTAEMVLSKTFPDFKGHFFWVFTLGLALSSAADVLITGSLFFLLRTSRTSDFNFNAVIDALIRYAFETGFLTAAGTVISMICWLAMSQNLIFMGLHFVIAKLYANSLLVTLNTRRTLRRTRSSLNPGSRENQMAFRIADARRVSHYPLSSKDSALFPNVRSPKVTINIERSVHCEEDPA